MYVKLKIKNMDEKIIIPIGLFIAACWSTYRGIKASKSGSVGGGNVPFYKTGGGVFAIILFAATIGVIIWMVNDR